MSRLSVEGLIDINLSPFEYFISLFIFITLIGELLTSKPDEIILSINTFAEPSNIGTSSLSISIKV